MGEVLCNCNETAQGLVPATRLWYGISRRVAQFNLYKGVRTLRGMKNCTINCTSMMDTKSICDERGWHHAFY